jgi:hypothetical protein
LQIPRNDAHWAGRPATSGSTRHEARRYIATMIVRVLTATVSDRASPRLHELMRQQLPILREYDGLIYVKLARRLIGREEEVILFEEWRDATAMYAWTGPNIDRPRLLPGAEDLISELRIAHYEALDLDPPI